MKYAMTRKQILGVGVGAAGVVILGCGNEGARTGRGGEGGEGEGGARGSEGGDGGTSAQGGSGGAAAQGGSGEGGSGEGGQGASGGAGGSASGGAGGSASGGAGGTGNAAACSRNISASISLNHGHALTIPLADIMAGAQKCYNARGGSNHDHWLTVTSADFAKLRNGEVVRLVSCNGGDHEYVLSCAPNAPAPVNPMCAGNDNRGAMSCQ